MSAVQAKPLVGPFWHDLQLVGLPAIEAIVGAKLG